MKPHCTFNVSLMRKIFFFSTCCFNTGVVPAVVAGSPDATKLPCVSLSAPQKIEFNRFSFIIFSPLLFCWCCQMFLVDTRQEADVIFGSEL